MLDCYRIDGKVTLDIEIFYDKRTNFKRELRDLALDYIFEDMSYSDGTERGMDCHLFTLAGMLSIDDALDFKDKAIDIQERKYPDIEVSYEIDEYAV